MTMEKVINEKVVARLREMIEHSQAVEDRWAMYGRRDLGHKEKASLLRCIWYVLGADELWLSDLGGVPGVEGRIGGMVFGVVAHKQTDVQGESAGHFQMPQPVVWSVNS
jgi:hypothetical protein